MAIETAFNFYLIPLRPVTVFTGQISQTPTDPFITLNYANGVTGSFSPLDGMTTWFGTSSNNNDVGLLRLRQFSPNGTNGTIKVAESDDVGPLIVSGTFITIKHEWRLWSVYPNIIQNNGSVTFFEDFDIAYSQQTVNWFPQAVAGPPGVSFLSGGQATMSFVGNQSQAHTPGATITTFLWESPESNEGSSSSQGTEASPVVFTYTSLGSKRVSLTVTDSNGNTSKNYTWAFIIDPDNPSNAYLDFERASDSGDFAQGGGQMNFMTHEGANTDDFPEEGLVVLATDKNLSNANGYWPFRGNVHFVGYIVGDSVRQDPTNGDVNFRATTLDGVMRKTTMFPISMTDKIGPFEWTMGKNLTVDRISSYLVRWRSSMHFMANVIFSSYSGLINHQDFGFESLYQMFSTLMSSAWGKAVCDHQSVFRITIDFNLRLTAERNTSTLKTLQKGIWVDNVGIEERSAYLLPANQCKMSGVAYPGNEVTDLCPLFSEAPGGVPKYFGRELNFDRLILTNQDDLNTRSGFGLAQANPTLSQFNIRFINDGDFNFSTQDVFPLVIESGDNDRGISFSGNVICRGFSRIYNNQNGSIIIDARFEPVTTGPAGITVVIDCTAPPQKRFSSNVTSQNTPLDSYAPLGPLTGEVALTSANLGTSFYFIEAQGQSWQRRVNGLPGLNVVEMDKDPWTYFRQGRNINKIIVWACGEGFLARSEDTGQTWVDYTTYIPDPPNVWGTPAASGTAEEITYRQIAGDLFDEGRLHLLAEWQQNSGSLWYGWLGQSIDDGFNWDWTALSGTNQVRPFRFAIDRESAETAWVTTWESGNELFLRKHLTSNLSLSSKSSLGLASTNQMLTEERIAYPFGPLGDKDLVYCYGRMVAPNGATGSVAILKSTDGASSFSQVEDTWGTQQAGSVLVSVDNEAGDRSIFAVQQRESGTSSWTFRKTLFSTAGRMASVQTDGANIYFIQDTGTTGIPKGSVFKYDPSDNSISTVTNIANFAVRKIAWFKGNLYLIYGGVVSFNDFKVAKWNGTEDSVTDVVDMTLPGSFGSSIGQLYTDGSFLVALVAGTPNVVAPHENFTAKHTTDGSSWSDSDTPNQINTNSNTTGATWLNRETRFPLDIVDVFCTQEGHPATCPNTELGFYRFNNGGWFLISQNPDFAEGFHHNSSQDWFWQEGDFPKKKRTLDYQTLFASILDIDVSIGITSVFLVGDGWTYAWGMYDSVSVPSNGIHICWWNGVEWRFLETPVPSGSTTLEDRTWLIRLNDANNNDTFFIHTVSTTMANIYKRNDGPLPQPAKFYSGVNDVLIERSTLPIAGVRPGAMDINSVGLVVLGSNADSEQSILSGGPNYGVFNDNSLDYPKGNPVTSVKFV